MTTELTAAEKNRRAQELDKIKRAKVLARIGKKTATVSGMSKGHKPRLTPIRPRGWNK